MSDVWKNLQAMLTGVAALQHSNYPSGHKLVHTSGGFRYVCECGERMEGIVEFGSHIVKHTPAPPAAPEPKSMGHVFDPNGGVLPVDDEADAIAEGFMRRTAPDNEAKRKLPKK